MKNQRLKIILHFGLSFCILIFAFCISGAKVVDAATLYLSPSAGSYTVNQSFSVSVYVSSADQAMNAVSGIISFPKDKLKVTSLSKTGSVISLWVQEPLFSNSTGTVNFEGIVLNPGFTGSSGKIISATFKVKAAGTASLVFSSGAVLANDGEGTNILGDMNGGTYTLKSIIVTPPGEEEEEDVPLSIVSSPTHPDPENWYSNNDPEFTWKLPSDVTGVSFLLHKKATANPGPTSDGLIETAKFEDIEDGVWYFHIKFRNQYGWGVITHRKVLIDTTPPRPFEIEVKEGKETTNPQPTLFFETTDEISEIDYYEVKIDQESSIKIEENEYKMPVQALGEHTVIVKAIDMAGNYTLAMTEINILSIEVPIITDYPSELLPGSILLIKGTAIPEVTIKVYIQKEGKEVKTGETKSDKEGKWVYIEVESVEKGIYEVWAEAIDSSGAKSNPSEKVTVLVSPPVFIRIGKLTIDYLTVVISLFGLILAILFVLVWFWKRMQQKKRRLKKEVSEAEKALYQAFKALKQEIEGQVAKLDGRPGLSKREKKICAKLKGALKISEKFIDKEIKDILKELK